MATVQELVRRLEASRSDVFWQGKPSDAAIDRLEALLGSRLSTSYRSFLNESGGGGIVGAEIAGIESGDPELLHRGTLLGDTMRCREEFDLPVNLLAIRLEDDEFAWCLDTNRFDGDECSVVTFAVPSRRISFAAPTFLDYFDDYVTQRIRPR